MLEKMHKVLFLVSVDPFWLLLTFYHTEGHFRGILSTGTWPLAGLVKGHAQNTPRLPLAFTIQKRSNDWRHTQWKTFNKEYIHITQKTSLPLAGLLPKCKKTALTASHVRWLLQKSWTTANRGRPLPRRTLWFSRLSWKPIMLPVSTSRERTKCWRTQFLHVDMANMQAQSDLHREIVSTPTSFTQWDEN